MPEDSVKEEANRQRSKHHPRHSLQKAEEFGRNAFDLGPRNCDLDRVAQASGYKNAHNGAFAALRGSATAFGIVRNTVGSLSVSENWIDAFHSEDEESLRQERQKSALNPTLYKQLFQYFEKRQLPSIDKLARTLHLDEKYGILKDAAPQAAQVFIESMQFAGLIDSKGYLVIPEATATLMLDDTVNDIGGEKPSKPNTSFAHSSTFNPNLSVPDTSSLGYELDHIEIKLRNGMKAFLYVPVPLPFGEKERIKKYIDLLLEDDAPSQ